MGFWSTCYQFGSWVANPIAVAFIGVAALAWRGAFVFPAVIVAGVGIVIFLFLPEKRVPVDEEERARFHDEVKRERARVLRTPLVWALGSAYFFMKLIRYVLFFWLPYYMRRELGYKRGVAATLGDIANVRVKQGQHTAAQALYQESLGLFCELGNQRGVAGALAGLACLAYAQAQPLLAACLLGKVDALLAQLLARLDEPQHSDKEQVAAVLHAQLGAEQFGAAWAQGGLLGLEELITRAIAVPGV